MEITKNVNGSSMEIVLAGRLDTTTAPELEAVLRDLPDDLTELIFDFEKLEYISSAGLRVLLQAHKFMNGKGTMKVIHVNEVVNEIFDVTGFTDILNIE